MLLKRTFYIIFIIVCFSNCSNKKNTKTNKLQIFLIDSTNYSSKIVSLQLFNSHNKNFGYSVGENKTIETYKISKQGKLKILEQRRITNKLGGTRALTVIKIKDSNLLLLGNKADNSIEVHKIKENGKLEKINAVYDTDSTFIDETVTIHAKNINDRTFIFAGGLDNGVSSYELSENG